MPDHATSPLHDYVDEHPRELWGTDDVVGGLDRLLRLVEPIVDREAHEGPAQAA